jgi:tRNA G18 (ribose-2'-O)-methylase SpoU
MPDQPVRIDVADDPRLADYRELKDAAARRRIEGDALFVAEGPVAIERMLASGHRPRSVLVSDAKWERMADLLGPVDAPVYVVTVELLQDIVGFDLHRGAIAAADRRPAPDLDEVLCDVRRIAVVEGLNDPENLGAIARSARALGIDALLLDPTCIDPYTRRTVRVSMGEILFLPRVSRRGR